MCLWFKCVLYAAPLSCAIAWPCCLGLISSGHGTCHLSSTPSNVTSTLTQLIQPHVKKPKLTVQFISYCVTCFIPLQISSCASFCLGMFSLRCAPCTSVFQFASVHGRGGRTDYHAYIKYPWLWATTGGATQGDMSPFLVQFFIFLSAKKVLHYSLIYAYQTNNIVYSLFFPTDNEARPWSILGADSCQSVVFFAGLPSAVTELETEIKTQCKIKEGGKLEKTHKALKEKGRCWSLIQSWSPIYYSTKSM